MQLRRKNVSSVAVGLAFTIALGKDVTESALRKKRNHKNKRRQAMMVGKETKVEDPSIINPTQHSFEIKRQSQQSADKENSSHNQVSQSAAKTEMEQICEMANNQAAMTVLAVLFYIGLILTSLLYFYINRLIYLQPSDDELEIRFSHQIRSQNLDSGVLDASQNPQVSKFIINPP